MNPRQGVVVDCRRFLDEVFSLARLDKLFLLVMVLRAHPGIVAVGGEKSRISTIILARSDGIRAVVVDLNTLRIIHGGIWGALSGHASLDRAAACS